ncbi:hypothetical protein FBU30_002786 [Linnemannia zychae]|nr:hypothetical protein FBU30_002786 [Linnemannia zychae]
MSRYPTQDHQRSIHSNNTTHFQEGHHHPENSDWHQSGDLKIQSTGSVSSYASWSSQDPVNHSSTNSYIQQQQQYHQSPHQQLHYNYSSQSPQQHRGSPASQRGISLTSVTSGRYRSNSNNSIISSSTTASSNMYNQHHPQHHQQHYRSNTTSMSSNSDFDSHFGQQHPHHLSYSSQTSSGTHTPHTSYSPQQHQQYLFHQKLQQQQLQQQQQKISEKQQHQRASDSSFSGDITRDSTATVKSDLSSASSRSDSSFTHRQQLPQQQQQQQEAPRSSSRLQQRRREPTTAVSSTHGSLTTTGDKLDANELPSLDDYEAMLEKMASPNLGPREARSTARRKEREPREPRESRPTMDRAARQARRQMEQQAQQQTPQQELLVVADKTMNHEKSFEERRLRRRSSLPSKLKATPNMFAGLSRRNSGSNGGSKSFSSPTESPTLRALVMDNGGLPPPQQQHQKESSHFVLQDDDFSTTNPSTQDFAHLPSLQRKRYSWENENIVPRMDLLSANKSTPLVDPARLPSRHDLAGSDINPQVHAESTLTPAANPNFAQGTRESSHTQAPKENAIDFEPTVEEGSFVGSIASTTRHRDSTENQQSLHPLSSTPTSRSRPGTPLGNIRPPLGPSPPTATTITSGTAPIPIPLARKISPTSKKPKPGHTRASPSSGNIMLQPFALGNARPRAGSSGSNGSFTLDGIIAPPPPSSPLPSLPPPAPSSGSSETTMVGLGIAHPPQAASHISRSRKPSAGARDLIRPPPHLLLQNECKIPPMIPSSTPPELGHTAAATAAAVAAASAAADLKAQQERHERELQEAVKQIQDEKEALMQVMKERHDQSHSEMVDQLESYRMLLQAKEDEIMRIREAERETMEAFRRDLLAKEDEILKIQMQQNELQNVRQQLEDKEKEASRIETAEKTEAERYRALIQSKEEEFQRLRTEHEEIQIARQNVHESEKEKLSQEIFSLSTAQSQLEKELDDARRDIHNLSQLVKEREQLSAEERQARETVESRIETIEKASHQTLEDQRHSHEAALSELDIQILDLEETKVKLEEANHQMKQELEAFEARFQQEEAQYRILQDSVQRLSSKMSRMEAQHTEEIEQLQKNHEEAMHRISQEHADTLDRLTQQHKVDIETELEQLRNASDINLQQYRHESEVQLRTSKAQLQDAFDQDRQGMEARERVLRDRIDAQSERNDQLEEEVFELRRTQETILKEKEILARTNRSLERHVSMQHLQQQENVFKMEELERENARLKEILADLDIAAALAARQQHDSGESSITTATAAMADMFAQQQRKWIEKVEQMARKVARAEEEARRFTEQNIDLKVALDLASQTHSAKKTMDMVEHLAVGAQEHKQYQSQNSTTMTGTTSLSPETAFVSRPSTPPPTANQTNGVMSPPLSA